MLSLLLLFALADPTCNTRKPGMDPDCITYETAGEPARPKLTCKVACYTKTKRDGGLDSFVLHGAVEGADTPASRDTCRVQLQTKADKGCKD